MDEQIARAVISLLGGGSPSGLQLGEKSSSPVASAAKAVLGGMTLSPIVHGLMSLFGGDDEPAAPPPLPRYSAPAAVRLNAGLIPGGDETIAVDYDAYGAPRAMNASPQGASAPASVTVNVQAIDSRSFLDHSDAIAQAVRRAMLESSPLNDVVAEL